MLGRRFGLRLGVIADDVTGGADLAGMLMSQGVRTLLCLDVTAVPAEAVVDDSRWDAHPADLRHLGLPSEIPDSRSARTPPLPVDTRPPSLDDDLAAFDPGW